MVIEVSAVHLWMVFGIAIITKFFLGIGKEVMVNIGLTLGIV